MTTSSYRRNSFLILLDEAGSGSQRHEHGHVEPDAPPDRKKKPLAKPPVWVKPKPVWAEPKSPTEADEPATERENLVQPQTQETRPKPKRLDELPPELAKFVREQVEPITPEKKVEIKPPKVRRVLDLRVLEEGDQPPVLVTANARYTEETDHALCAGPNDSSIVVVIHAPPPDADDEEALALLLSD